jgi:hypothetical protein
VRVCCLLLLGFRASDFASAFPPAAGCASSSVVAWYQIARTGISISRVKAVAHPPVSSRRLLVALPRETAAAAADKLAASRRGKSSVDGDVSGSGPADASVAGDTPGGRYGGGSDTDKNTGSNSSGGGGGSGGAGSSSSTPATATAGDSEAYAFDAQHLVCMRDRIASFRWQRPAPAEASSGASSDGVRRGGGVPEAMAAPSHSFKGTLTSAPSTARL